MSGLDFADDTRTFAVTDFDNDGNPDIILKSRLGPQIRAMQNDSANNRPAIAIQLQGVKSNRDGIGTVVRIGDQYAERTTTVGYASSADTGLHFGLGNLAIADKIAITWPSGRNQTLTSVKADQVLNVTEP